MTDALIVLVGIVVCAWISYWSNKLVGIVQNEDRYHRATHPITPMVTPTHPDLTNPNAVGQGDSVIVEPKSPQLVQWEEDEQLRKINLKPR